MRGGGEVMSNIIQQVFHWTPPSNFCTRIINSISIGYSQAKLGLQKLCSAYPTKCHKAQTLILGSFPQSTFNFENSKFVLIYFFPPMHLLTRPLGELWASMM